MYNILHITTHMGGGVGKTLSDICIYNKNNKKYRHSILCLEKTDKNQFLNSCIDNGVYVTISDDLSVIEEKIKQADIVQLSWWHHPKMVKLLAEFPDVPIRLIIWSHVSGCNYPSVPYAFLEKAHRVFFTSKYSYDNPFFSERQIEYIRYNSDVIYGSSDLSNITVGCKYNKDNKDTFNIGYIGTLDYSKLYPNFIRLCSEINIPNVKFIMVGDMPNNKEMLSDIGKYNMQGKIEFRGYKTDVFHELLNFDVFGYPLNFYHFGTTENAILEAMVFKLPVVAFNQCAEKYLIDHMKTGLLSANDDEYVKNIEYLYRNNDEIIRIGENARKHVLNEFETNRKMDKVEKAYDEVLNMKSRAVEFKSVFGSEPYEWFLSCLGEDYNLFKDAIDAYEKSDKEKMLIYEEKIKRCHQILKGQSKSSINHFYNYYSDDKFIKYIKGILES